MTALRAPARPRRPSWTAAALLIGLAATAVRLLQLWRTGFLALGFYDDDVHFAAAVDLVHGRLPYRDDLFLQPPGVVLAAGPFAALAQLTGDPTAFVAVRIACAVLGGGNAALIVVLLRRFGAPAALIGGALYACSFPAVYVERTLAIEGLGTTAVLVALLLLGRARDLESGAGFVLAGVAAGSAIGLKIWYIVPAAVLVLAAHGGRLRVLLGAALAVLAVYGPFFEAAPERMWQQVVLAQFGRPDAVDAGPWVRVRSMLGVVAPAAPQPAADVLALGLAALVVLLAAVALGSRRAHVFVALLAATAGLLLAVPSSFQHYAALTAAPLALVGGVGAGRLVAALPGRRPRVVGVLLVLAGAAALGLPQDLRQLGYREPAGMLTAVGRVHGCVIADDPGALIVADRLTAQVDRGCALHADPSGIGFVLPGPAGTEVERLDKPAFQRAIVGYLHSGDAYVLSRGPGLQLSAAAARLLQRDRLLHRQDRFVLRAAPR